MANDCNKFTNIKYFINFNTFLNTYFNHLHNTSIIFLIFISEKN